MLVFMSAFFWCRTGDKIVTGSKEGEVQIWDVDSGQLLSCFSSK